jgi:hypothetical protein
LTKQYREKNHQGWEVVFQRGGSDVETLYWAGSNEEVGELAEDIASRRGADTYRIVELSGINPVNNYRAPSSDA